MVTLLRAFRVPLALFLLLGLGLTAVACGSDDDDSGAATDTPAAGTVTRAPKTAYPLKVTDLLGREVEIKSRPANVVALSPTAAELVYAAGGKIVGRASSVDYPAEAKQAKEVGTAYQPNFESILALKPDLVVADSVIHAQPNLRKPIEDLPVPVLFAGADSYQKVQDGITLMGKVFDDAEGAQKVLSDIEKAKNDAKAAIGGKRTSAVALIADRDQTLYAAKDNSYSGDILKQLGITNPAASQPDAGPFPGYTALASEKLLEFNPDYILAITPAPPPAPRLASLIPQIPPFKGLHAVTQQHVVDTDVDLFLQAPGPRIAEAFKAIAAAVTGSGSAASGSPTAQGS